MTRLGEFQRHGEGSGLVHSNGDERTSDAEKAVAQESATARWDEAVVLLAIVVNGSFIGHGNKQLRVGDG